MLGAPAERLGRPRPHGELEVRAALEAQPARASVAPTGPRCARRSPAASGTASAARRPTREKRPTRAARRDVRVGLARPAAEPLDAVQRRGHREAHAEPRQREAPTRGPGTTSSAAPAAPSVGGPRVGREQAEVGRRPARPGCGRRARRRVALDRDRAVAHPVQAVRPPQRRELLRPVVALVVVGRRAPHVQPRPVSSSDAEPRAARRSADRRSPAPKADPTCARAGSRDAPARRRDRELAPGDLVARRRPRLVGGQHGADGQPGLAGVGGRSSGSGSSATAPRGQRPDAQLARDDRRALLLQRTTRTSGARGRGT